LGSIQSHYHRTLEMIELKIYKRNFLLRFAGMDTTFPSG
jgi:hypothetical protein